MNNRFSFGFIAVLIAITSGIGLFYLSQAGLFSRSDFLAQIVGEQSNSSEQASSATSTLLPMDIRATTTAASTTEKVVEKEREVSIIFVGDIMLSRVVAEKIKKNNNPEYPFLKIGDELKTADIVFGNLETSLTPGREIGPEEMVFRAAPEMAFVLKKFGFLVLSLANNHTMNFGQAGLLDTMLNLSEVGVHYIGAGRNSFEAYWPRFIAKNGLLFAFLAYTDNDVAPASYFASTSTAGVAYMDKEKMQRAVKIAKALTDIVIVSMHSGSEYKDTANQRQISFARSAIDAGCDLVIGHHPHVVQTAERYKGKYIFYSLGNFVFDQRWWKTKEGVILKVIFNQQGVKQIEPQAIYIEDFSQPKLLTGEPAQKIIDRLGISFNE